MIEFKNHFSTVLYTICAFLSNDEFTGVLYSNFDFFYLNEFEAVCVIKVRSNNCTTYLQ